MSTSANNTKKRTRDAMRPSEYSKIKFDTVDIAERWEACIGKPELKGWWIIYGPSGHGKTSCAFQLAKALARHRKVEYDSLEEGFSLSIQYQIDRAGMSDVNDRFLVLNRVKKAQLKERLAKPKSAKIIFVDSVKYSRFTYDDIIELEEMFPDKLFIGIAHGDKKLPVSTVGRDLEFHSMVKLRVEGYKAFPKSRFGANEPYVIWDKGAERYWGDNNKTSKTV